jgi:ASPM-SPD-2-Hydin domain-containing protein
MSHAGARRALAAAAVLVLVSSTAASAHERRAVDAPGAEAAPRPAAVVPGLDFGQVQLGTTTAGQDYVYTNGTADPVTVTLMIMGWDPGDFAISTEDCTQAPVPSSASCTVTLTFTPTAEYARSASLNVTDGQVDPPVVPLAGVGILADSAVVWGTTRPIGGSYIWTQGAALARSVKGSTEYLHAVIQRFDVAKQGIYYRRNTNLAASWYIGTRLNPSTQIGARSTAAASGAYVYAAWSSFARTNPSGGQPRVLYFRSNKTYGSGSWATIKRLTSTTGRIDYPRLSAYGSSVYVTYTDSATGSVKIQVSRDRGATWRVVALGTTTRSDSLGRIGAPVVASYGTTVAVAWISSTAGTVKFRSSSNYGRTWSATTTLGGAAHAGSGPSIAAGSGRFAVAWTGNFAMSLRVRTGTTWGPLRTLAASAGSLHTYLWPWQGQVAMTGTTRVGIAFESCWAGCAASDPAVDYRGDMLWRESADNGATWAKSQVVFETGSGFDEAYFPSVIWASATKRYVMFGATSILNQVDRVLFRAGIGTP